MKIFVFDTELGGLDMRKHSVLEVGALVGDLETGEIFEEYESLVKLPSREDYCVTEEAFNIHKITVEECMRDGNPPEEIGEKLADMYSDHGAVLYGGHNVDIDVRGVSRHILGIDPEDWAANFTYRKIDTHDFVRLLLGTEHMKSGATLGQVAKMLGLKTSDAGGSSKYHRALFDSQVTFMIMRHFRQVFKSEAFGDLIKKK